METASPLKGSDTIGRYHLIGKLGDGGMASVYRAEIRGEGGFRKTVALKVIHSSLLINPEFSRMFISEARLGGLLSHPCVVQTFDFGQLEGQLYLAMEWVDGPTLAQALKYHREQELTIPVDVTLQLMVNILDGLGYAHQATDHLSKPLGMVHRDLKPANILISRRGHVKISDFGVARATSNIGHTQHSGIVKGTLHYMSPEQAWGCKDIDFRSDLFSVGLILFECLTLQPLYQAESVELGLRLAQDAEVEERLEILPEELVELGLKDILMRCMAFEPEDRYQCAEDFAADLNRVLDSLPQRTLLMSWFGGTFTEPFWQYRELGSEAEDLYHSDLRPTDVGLVAGSLAGSSAQRGSTGGGSSLSSRSSIGRSTASRTAAPEGRATTLRNRSDGALAKQEGEGKKGFDPPWSVRIMVMAFIFAAGVFLTRYLPNLIGEQGTAPGQGEVVVPSSGGSATEDGSAGSKDGVESAAGEPSSGKGEAVGSASHVASSEATPGRVTSQASSSNEGASQGSALKVSGPETGSLKGTLGGDVPVDGPSSVSDSNTSTDRVDNSTSQSSDTSVTATEGSSGPTAANSEASVPDAGGTAELILNARPKALILIDGARIGETPLRGYSISTGQHAIVFELDAEHKLQQQIEVNAGSTLSCVAYFTRDTVQCR